MMSILRQSNDSLLEMQSSSGFLHGVRNRKRFSNKGKKNEHKKNGLVAAATTWLQRLGVL